MHLPLAKECIPNGTLQLRDVWRDQNQVFLFDFLFSLPVITSKKKYDWVTLLLSCQQVSDETGSGLNDVKRPETV